MAGVVALRPQFRGSAECIRDGLGRTLIIGGERNPHVAIVEDGVVLAIGLDDLIERLRDQVGADAVARHER
jgi:hypothetical protein